MYVLPFASLPATPAVTDDVVLGFQPGSDPVFGASSAALANMRVPAAGTLVRVTAAVLVPLTTVDSDLDSDNEVEITVFYRQNGTPGSALGTINLDPANNRAGQVFSALLSVSLADSDLLDLQFTIGATWPAPIPLVFCGLAAIHETELATVITAAAAAEESADISTLDVRVDEAEAPPSQRAMGPHGTLDN